MVLLFFFIFRDLLFFSGALIVLECPFFTLFFHSPISFAPTFNKVCPPPPPFFHIGRLTSLRLLCGFFHIRPHPFPCFAAMSVFPPLRDAFFSYFFSFFFPPLLLFFFLDSTLSFLFLGEFSTAPLLASLPPPLWTPLSLNQKRRSSRARVPLLAILLPSPFP